MQNKSSASVRIFYPRWTRERLVEALRAKVPALAGRLPLARVLLFGSFAKGRFTATSDIDLLVVYRGEPREDAYALVRRTLDIPGLEPHVYTEDEYEASRPTVDRMTEDAVVLFEGRR